MGHLGSKVSKGVKRYWRRRRYQHLTASTDEPGSKTKRRSWRIKIPSKLKVKLRFKLKFNPKKLLNKFHRAYVNMMMKVANSPALSGGGLVGYGGDGISQFGMRPVKEYDEKLVIQMYNAMVMRQAQLAAALKVDQAPQITCSG